MESGRRRLRSCFANASPGGRGSPSVLTMKDCPILRAGRGADEGGESPPDEGAEWLCPYPGSTVPRPKIAAVERRKAGALAMKRALPRRIARRTFRRPRLSALCPLVRGMFEREVEDIRFTWRRATRAGHGLQFTAGPAYMWPGWFEGPICRFAAISLLF